MIKRISSTDKNYYHSHLLGKFPDTLDEVLVGSSVAGDELPQRRDYAERILVVRPLKQRALQVTELKYHDLAAWAEDSVCIFKRFLYTYTWI